MAYKPTAPIGLLKDIASKKTKVDPRNALSATSEGARMGFKLGTATADTDDAAARKGFLSRGYKSTLHDPTGDARAARNAARGEGEMQEVPTRAQSEQERNYLAAQVKPFEDQELRRQEQIVNALRQEAARQKMEIEAQDAAQKQRFFEETGAIASPQVMAEMTKIQQRERVSEDFQKGLGEIQEQLQLQLRQLLRPGVDPNSPEIQRAIAKLEAKAAAAERNLMLISGVRSGTARQNADKMMMPQEPEGY